MKYVILENDIPVKISNVRGFVPANSMRVPENTRSHEEISIVEVDDGFGELIKTAELDPIKVAAYDDILSQEETDNQARLADRQATKDKVVALRTASLNTMPDLKQAVIDILDYLEIS